MGMPADRILTAQLRDEATSALVECRCRAVAFDLRAALWAPTPARIHNRFTPAMPL